MTEEWCWWQRRVVLVTEGSGVGDRRVTLVTGEWCWWEGRVVLVGGVNGGRGEYWG